MSAPGRLDVDGDGGFERRALLLVVAALIASVGGGYLLALAWSAHAAASALALAGVPLTAGLLLALRGRCVAAGRLTLASALALVARLMYVGGGTDDIVVIAWPALTLAAGLLLRRRDLYVFLAVAIGASAWVAWSRQSGAAVPFHENPAFLRLGVIALVVVLTGVAADVLILNLRRSLSESLASERALRASEERFNRAFHASPAAMVITRLSDRGVIDANEAFLRAIGKRHGEILGRPMPDQALWFGAAQRAELYRALGEKRSLDERQVRYRRKRGDDGLALVSGAVVEIGGEPCALFAALDLTDRLRAEAALSTSEERYRLISRLISDYTFSTRVGEDGSMRLEWVAGAFEHITGYSFDQYVARGGWRASLHPEDLEVDDRALERIRQRQRAEVEVRTIVPGGEVRWVRVYGHPVWDEERDRLAGIHGAVKDITAQKQAELDREALIVELEAKNEELERFTYTVSHDLKSPLLTIRGFLGHVVAAIGKGDAEAALADLGRVRNAATRMGRLLDELLELSRIGRVVSPPVETPFEEIVREAVSLCRGRLDARGARVRIQEGLPVVHGDRSRLVEVVQNLLDNAVKFTPEDRTPQIEVGARREEGRSVLFVADDGIGVEPAHRQKIFGLFDKLDARSEGTGIGLALVERIVRLHDGEVWVESEGAGRGSRFCFTLTTGPAAVAPDRAAPETAS